MSDRKNAAKTAAFFGVMLCLSLILSYIESALSFSSAVPFIKPGFSNIPVVITLYLSGFWGAFVLGIAKSVLSLLFLGRLGSLFYSLCGIIFAVAGMGIAKKSDIFSLLGVNAAGSAAHIAGQMLAAVLMLSDTDVLRLFPYLILFSLISGAVTYFPELAVLKFLNTHKNIGTGTKI